VSNDSKDSDLGERLWVNNLCENIKEHYKLDNNCQIKCEVALPHSIALNNFLKFENGNTRNLVFNKNLTDEDINKYIETWNVDLLIYEESENKGIIPRVVIEAKYKDINTHDPITYSHKAELHKRLFPGLRYGVIVGNYGCERKDKNIYIPTRVVEYGNNFDFIFLFKNNNNADEIKKFVELLNKNIEISKKLEKFNDKNIKKCCIEKNIEFYDNIISSEESSEESNG
jgi:hypothetical protein